MNYSELTKRQKNDVQIYLFLSGFKNPFHADNESYDIACKQYGITLDNGRVVCEKRQKRNHHK